MSEHDSNYQHVYTGSEVNVQYLENIFEKAGINSIQKDNFESGLRAGFGGGAHGQVQLFVERNHLEEAQKIADSVFPQEGKEE